MGTGMKIGAAVMAVMLAAGVGVGHYFTVYALKRENDSVEKRVSSLTDAAAQEETSPDVVPVSAQTSVQAPWERMERAFVCSRDGLKLSGEYAVQREGHRWAVLVHGYRMDCHSMEMYAAEYYRRGYHVLLPDNRACGESEGSYLGMGWLDRMDLLQWIDWILGHDPEAEIIFHGESMGAAAVMMLSGEKLPSQVKGFVEDCGYTSVKDIFTGVLKAWFSLPPFPVLNLSSLYARAAAGYGFWEASALKQVKKNTRPMLFIHGEQDDFVPTGMVYPLYEAAAGRKALYIASGAGHAQSMTSDPVRYWETVFSFLNQTNEQ